LPEYLFCRIFDWLAYLFCRIFDLLEYLISRHVCLPIQVIG